MILCIFLTVFLAWLVLMGAYWLHGRKGVGTVCRSCGKPMGAGSDTCSDCYGDLQK